MSPPAVTRGPRAAGTPAPPRIPAWFVLALAVLAAAATVLMLVVASQAVELPQVTVSDGDQSRLPAQPEPGPFTTLLGMAAFATVLLGPLVGMWVAVWAGTWAWLSWEQLRSRDRAVLLAAAVLAACVVAAHFSPLGRDVTRGWLD